MNSARRVGRWVIALSMLAPGGIAPRILEHSILEHSILEHSILEQGTSLPTIAPGIRIAAAATPTGGAKPRATLWWDAEDDIPLPAGARSMIPVWEDLAVYGAPGNLSLRRGSLSSRARIPFFSQARAPNCLGRWLEVGAEAWICSHRVEFSSEAPSDETEITTFPDGLPFRYFFVGPQGSAAYANLASAGEAAPAKELDPGWAVAIVEQRRRGEETWGKTRAGLWIAMRDLGPARPSLFQGAVFNQTELRALEAGGPIPVAWVQNYARVFQAPRGTYPLATYTRQHRVTIVEETTTKAAGKYVRIASESEAEAWMRAGDLVRPTREEPPKEVTGPEEPWIDVDLRTQTLVAYRGRVPVFATLVSTGKGSPGTDSATHKGTFRIWIKLRTSTMDNLEKEDASHYYSMEDVPFVQFFDKSIALHGAFWHRDFGRVRSHGCVNLSPLDAAWLFAFTGPHLPTGWTAVLPGKENPATIVRVR
jgi:lipoprotein-anchoring transpeptidase ErfK/SrfK